MRVPAKLTPSEKMYSNEYYFARAEATSTATATVQPTIGLLPIPRNPIIST